MVNKIKHTIGWVECVRVRDANPDERNPPIGSTVEWKILIRVVHSKIECPLQNLVSTNQPITGDLVGWVEGGIDADDTGYQSARNPPIRKTRSVGYGAGKYPHLSDSVCPSTHPTSR